jgi:hypothetical protein
MRNISTTVRGHYDDDGYMRAIIIRRFCDTPLFEEEEEEEEEKGAPPWRLTWE